MSPVSPVFHTAVTMRYIDRAPHFCLKLKAYFSYQLAKKDSFDQCYNISPVTICFLPTKANQRSFYLTSKINKIAS